MQFEQAARMGLLTQRLGISPNARVSVTVTRQGTVFDDLETGIRHEVPDGDPLNVRRETFEVPKYVKEIIALPDRDLVEQFRCALGNLNLQMLSTLRSECGFRGIDPLD